ncbi:MAG: DUF805 domain-containing protein [Prevotella sp.]|nr:DUF805 domain-containing protein [Prevotella sp.]
MEAKFAKPQMSFVEAVKTCFKKYVDFTGRARRSEYWWFSVLNIILGICSSLVFNWKMTVRSELEAQVGEAIFDQQKMDAIMAQAESCNNTFTLLMLLIGVACLALFLPSLAVLARRLHDTGRSGWYILLGIIPIVNFIGCIVLFIFTVMDSKPEDNKYGPSPKYSTE